MSFAAKRKKKKKSSNRIKDKQVPHTLLQKLSPKSLTSPLNKNKDSKHWLKGVDREKSAVFKELTQSFRTYELRGQAKKKKKKALTESKTNKYLTLSYKNYRQKAWPPP